MCAPVGMLHGRSMVVVVVIMLRQVNVRRWQHRGKHHGCNEQPRGGRAAGPGGNHAEILSGEASVKPPKSKQPRWS